MLRICIICALDRDCYSLLVEEFLGASANKKVSTLRRCAVLAVFWIERNNTISEDKNKMDFLLGWSIFGISLWASLSNFLKKQSV